MKYIKIILITILFSGAAYLLIKTNSTQLISLYQTFRSEDTAVTVECDDVRITVTRADFVVPPARGDFGGIVYPAEIMNRYKVTGYIDDERIYSTQYREYRHDRRIGVEIKPDEISESQSLKIKECFYDHEEALLSVLKSRAAFIPESYE